MCPPCFIECHELNFIIDFMFVLNTVNILDQIINPVPIFNPVLILIICGLNLKTTFHALLIKPQNVLNPFIFWSQYL